MLLSFFCSVQVKSSLRHSDQIRRSKDNAASPIHLNKTGAFWLQRPELQRCMKEAQLAVVKKNCNQLSFLKNAA